MSKAAAFGIRPEAVNAFLALADALDDMTDDGREPVCKQRPDQWSSDATTPARQDAAAACGFCPAQPACLAYALAQREPAGVWGGRDLTPKTRRKENARMKYLETLAWVDCSAPGCGSGRAVDSRHLDNITVTGWQCPEHESEATC